MKPMGCLSVKASKICLNLTSSVPKRLKPCQLTTTKVEQRRAHSDVHITRTGKTIVRVQGGRSSLGGHTATVFGATGFLGRYIVNRLARAGCTVVVPYREEMTKRHLKVTGDLGRIVFLEMDLRNQESIEECVRHSDIVYNLIGRNYPTKNFELSDVHIWGAGRIAEAVAKYDVDRFVHVSSHNADSNSTSEFFRTKAAGEALVREIFPETTLVRPAPMFGWEDKLLNTLASPGNIFTSNYLNRKLWPVHAIDVGMALEHMVYDDNTASQTYELYGPKEYSLQQISDLVGKEIVKKRNHINIPKAIRQPLLKYLNEYIWWPVGSADEVEREFIDQVIDPNARTFAQLGIEPVELESMIFQYVLPYRSSIYYDLPPMTEKEAREERKYLHVIDDQ